MERTWKADYEKFARTARENVAATLDNMDYPALERAAELILAAKAAGKRLHISGIGKPAHLAGYAASLFSSTGTPAYFLHGTEAVHGSFGQLVPGDVVIFISNSGNNYPRLGRDVGEYTKATDVTKDAGTGAYWGLDGNQTWADAYDALVDQIKAETDPAKRAEIYDQLNQQFYDLAPGILLANGVGRHYEQRWIRGWYDNPKYAGVYYYALGKQ